MTAPLIERDATDLRGALARGETSAVEIAAACLDRIDTCNDVVNAVVSLRPATDILAEAEDMDREGCPGDLGGLPIAVKDLVETRDLRTTHGSPIFAEHVPSEDALLARRLRAAGALIVGKTNTPEWGLGSHSYNPVHGVTRNPYDPSRSAGGSSGGASAALAARMLPLADGSDMMGSLRNPAGWNNVYGLRPSFGLVPADPVGETFLNQLATHGPMARSPTDLALLLGVLSGPVPGHPHALPAFEGMEPAERLRIGWIGTWDGYYPMEAGVIDLCETALGVLADLGHEVRALTPPFDPGRLWQSWATLRSWEVAMKLRPVYEDPDKRRLLKPEAIWEIERGLSLWGSDIHSASLIRSEWFATVAALDLDILALPSAQLFPFDAAWHWPQEIAGRTMDTYHRWMEVVVPASLIGVPTLCVPAGFGREGCRWACSSSPGAARTACCSALDATIMNAPRWPQTRPPDLDTMQRLPD